MPATAQSFQCHLLIVDKRHDDCTVFGGIAALDDDRISIVDAGFDHRITIHLKSIVLSPTEEEGWDIYTPAVVPQGFNGSARSDTAVKR
jgi:hypothetical protein